MAETFLNIVFPSLLGLTTVVSLSFLGMAETFLNIVFPRLLGLTTIVSLSVRVDIKDCGAALQGGIVVPRTG